MRINNKYEILTPDGWCDFKGILYKGEQPTITLSTENKSITCTHQHQIFNAGGEMVPANEYKCNDLIQSKDGIENIVNIEISGVRSVFDVIEIQNATHSFYANAITTKNCDELAFVPRRMAEEFWAAIQPTLSTGGSCIVTSTPNGDTDQFSQIWYSANRRFDPYGNVRPNGCGENGFYPVLILWDKHPDRGEEFEQENRAKLGDDRWSREFECIERHTILACINHAGQEALISIENLFQMLKKHNQNYDIGDKI